MPRGNAPPALNLAPTTQEPTSNVVVQGPVTPPNGNRGPPTVPNAPLRPAIRHGTGIPEHEPLSPSPLHTRTRRHGESPGSLDPTTDSQEDTYYLPYLFRDTMPPPGPQMYSRRACENTVNVVRPSRGTLNSLLSENEDTGTVKDELWVDPKTMRGWTFLTKVLPRFTSADLSRTTYSEKDPEDWVYNVYMQPALRLWLAVEHGAIQPVYEDPAWSFGSAPATYSVIPDGIVVNNRSINDVHSGKALITVEVKTTNALKGSTSRKLGTLEDLIPELSDRDGASKPITMKFCWPTDRKRNLC